MDRHEDDALRAFIYAAERLREAEAGDRKRSIRSATIQKASAMAQIAPWAERMARAALRVPAREE